MDSITRIKDYIRNNFPEWEKVDFSAFEETVDFRTDYSDLYKIYDDEIVLISYTNISITGSDRQKPQLRVFLDEYKRPFYFAKKHQLRFYLFSIFTKEDSMARGLDNFNPKEYIISIETNLDKEDSRRDLRSIYDYANAKINGRKFLKCSRANYKADINQASFIYIGDIDSPEKETFENFINIFDSRPYLNSINEIQSRIEDSRPIKVEGNSHYLIRIALCAKPFMLLAGISGTGKSRLVRELAFKSCPKCLQDKDGTTPGNYCMIEVKPNWHDSTELLGYYSRLGKGGYQWTKFVKFLVKAKMFPDVPFFVCLDEMNLAPVEQYFAEILSILETRKHPKVGETVDMEVIKTGTIVDAQYFRMFKADEEDFVPHTGEPDEKHVTDKDIYLKLYEIEKEDCIDEEVGRRCDLTTEGLTLPDNVLIIGTVNMDDTTHQFSRKVIDRAMTIEMNGGKLSEMYGGSKDLEYLDGKEQEEWQSAFKQRYVTADEVLKKYHKYAETLTEILPQRLEAINDAIKGTPFEVSYRVLNELTIMVGVILDTKGSDEVREEELDSIINQSVDNILLMKILPRIEGDREMFAIKDETDKRKILDETKLERLLKVAPEIEFTDEDKEKRRQTSRDKIKEMIDRLDSQEFTRFWP